MQVIETHPHPRDVDSQYSNLPLRERYKLKTFWSSEDGQLNYKFKGIRDVSRSQRRRSKKAGRKNLWPTSMSLEFLSVVPVYLVRSNHVLPVYHMSQGATVDA